MILSIILHLYFAINIFIAGTEYERDSSRRFGDFFYYLMIVLFAGLIFIVAWLWIIVVVPIYKRTWLNWAIATIHVWYKHIRKGEPTELYGNQLVQFRKNVMINRMPPFMRNFWFKIIDNYLQKQRNELTNHGEVSDF